MSFVFSQFSNIVSGTVDRDDGFIYNSKFDTKLASFFNQRQFDNFKIITAEQVHKDDIAIISNPLDDEEVLGVDGLITGQKNVLLIIKHADCTPIFIYDKKQNVIALIHSGWRGSYLNIGIKAVDILINNYHAKKENIYIYLGVGINSCCYKFDKKPDQADDPNWQKFILYKNNKWSIDIHGYLINSFLQYGINLDNISKNKNCTCCDKRYYSWYQQKKIGLKECRCGVSYIGMK